MTTAPQSQPDPRDVAFELFCKEKHRAGPTPGWYRVMFYGGWAAATAAHPTRTAVPPEHEICAKCSGSLDSDRHRHCALNRTAVPAAENRPVTKFVYMLNALEGAAQAENPAIAGYSGRRVAILDYVQGLEAENAKLREEQANLEHDISSYVEIDAEHHATNDALRARVAELELDAGRYRFLRRGDKGTYNHIMIYSGSQLDAAIDRAIEGDSHG